MAEELKRIFDMFPITENSAKISGYVPEARLANRQRKWVSILFPRATLYNRTDWHSFQGLNRCANCLTAHPRATPIVISRGFHRGFQKGFHFQNESCDCKIPELRGISHYHNEQLIAGRVNITDIRHPPMRGSM